MPNWNSADFFNTRWNVQEADALYVSKSGNDATNDGSPRRPFLTINKALSRLNYRGTVVVASGLWQGSINGVNNPDTGPNGLTRIIGDGLVVMVGYGASYLSTQGVNGLTLENLVVQDYTYIANRLSYITLNNCRLRNVPHVYNYDYGQWYFTSCLFEDCFQNSGPQVRDLLLDQCTFIRSSMTPTSHPAGGLRVIRNSHFDGSSLLALLTDQDYFDYNNMQGQIVNRSTGSNILSLAQFKAAYPSRGQNCTQAAPQFNNPAAGNYTLAQTSPLRNISTAGTYVGAYGIGIDFSGEADAETLVNARWDSASARFVPVDPTLLMSVEFRTKDTGRSWIMDTTFLNGVEDNIDSQTIDATLSYENVSGTAVDTPSGSIAASRGYWVQGYDSVTYNGMNYPANTFLFGVDGQTGYTVNGTTSGKVVRLLEQPNIRLFEMRTSVVSANDCNIAPLRMFAVNRTPTFNVSTGRSNGDAAFNPAQAEPVQVRWLKPKVTILPNSLS